MRAAHQLSSKLYSFLFHYHGRKVSALAVNNLLDALTNIKQAVAQIRYGFHWKDHFNMTKLKLAPLKRLFKKILYC